MSAGPCRGLRRFAAGVPAAEAQDRCGLCAQAAGAGHRHLVDVRQRSIICSCTACALLFAGPGGRYRTVPDRVCHDPDRPLTEGEWGRLRIPVAIAFFFLNSSLGRIVASYPSPAGVTECELDLAAWEDVAATRPLLRALAPDAEAILVIRGQPATGGDRGIETFLIPVDTCYALAGALRMNWHGFDGGTEVRRILTGFLADLRGRARTLEAA